MAAADEIAQRVGVGERDHVETALVGRRPAGLDLDLGGAEQAGEQPPLDGDVLDPVGKG